MITLNVFFKGIAGALGAVLCFLIYCLAIYYKSLFKKYVSFVKTKDTSNLRIWELMIFCVVSFAITWILSFSLLYATVDRFTLSGDDKAIIALFIALVTMLLIIIPYPKHYKAKYQNVRQILSKIKEHILFFIHKIKQAPKEDEKQVINYFFDYSLTTDIYGTPIIERIKDFYPVIKNGANHMIAQIVGFPLISTEGKMECEIIMASVLAQELPTDLIIQAIVLGEPKFHTLGISTLQNKIERYKTMYKSHIEQDFIKQRWPLSDFAKKYKKLKIVDFGNVDKFGNNKCPVFITNEDKLFVCHFSWSERSLNTADFIHNNINKITVAEYQSGEFVFRLKEDDDWLYDTYCDMVAYNVFCLPLKYQYTYSINDMISSLKERNITLSNDNSIIGYALSEGIRVTKGLAFSLGLIGNKMQL